MRIGRRERSRRRCERELRQRLEEMDVRPVTSRSRRLLHVPERPPAAVLRRALETLGPLYALFATYLATRVDLLPLRDCLELAACSPPILPVDGAEIRARLAATKKLPEEVLDGLDEAPFRCSPMFQWHRSCYRGDEVLLKVARPDLERQLAEEGDLLHVIADPRLLGGVEAPAGFSSVAAEFLDSLKQRLDLAQEAETLAELGTLVSHLETVCTVKVHAELGAARILATTLPEGDWVADLLEQTSDLHDAGRKLCLAWLQLALLEGRCPTALSADDMVLGTGGEVILCGGVFAALDRSSRRLLLEYMTSACHHEPDRSMEMLLRVSSREPAAAAQDRLRIELRQAEPFRAGGWSGSYLGERLADTMYLQWRCLALAGGTAGFELAALERGLAGIEQLARRLSPRRDALQEALADIRIIAAAVHLREELGPTRIRHNLVEVFKMVDDVSRHAEELIRGTRRRRGRDRGPATADRSWAALAVLLPAMALIVLTSQRLGWPDIEPHLVQGIGSVLLLILAAVLFVVISRGGDRIGSDDSR